MATLFSDAFTRADSATVDATNWEENLTGDWAIVSNKVRSQSPIQGPGTLLTTSSAHAATADVKVTVTQAATGADGGPVARWTSGTAGTSATGYAIDCYPATIEIYRHNASATGTLLRTTSVTQVANGVIRLEVTGTGATVTLKQFYNGTQQGADAADGTGSRITTAGRTGIYSWTGGVANGDYDDFLAEDFGSAGSTIPIAQAAPTVTGYGMNIGFAIGMPDEL